MELCEWAALPEDLLWRVANLLPIQSYIRLRAVCSSWHSAIPAKPLPYSPPWLLLPGEHGEQSESCTFLSIPANRAFRYPLIPQLRGMRCVGSHDEWLVVTDQSLNTSLLNPLTGAQIHLPSMTTLPQVEAVYAAADGSLSEFLLHDPRYEVNPISYPLEEFRDCLIEKIVFAPNPTPHDYVAVALCAQGQGAAYTKAGDTKWRVLKDPDVTKTPLFCDMVHHDGKFYGVTRTSAMVLLDLSGTSPKVTTFSEGLDFGTARANDRYLAVIYGYDKHLVFSDGNLHQVWRKIRAEYDDNKGTYRYVTEEIIVFRYVTECRPCCWREVRELHGQSILIGSNQSVSVQAVDVVPGGLRGSCVYFTDLTYGFGVDEVRWQIRDVGVFDMKKKSFEACYPPNSQLNSPPPIWFSPSTK